MYVPLHNTHVIEVLILMLLLSLISPSFAYDTNDFYFAYFWTQKPQVVLCDDAKVTLKNLEHALQFWKNVGIDVKSDVVVKTCTTKFAEGEIRITNQRDLDLDKYFGYTEREYNEGFLQAALITIEDTSSRNLKLLVHELGHAFGINHEYVDTSHIMHRYVMLEETRWK